jgi:N-formylglutamate amidohydrolase
MYPETILPMAVHIPHAGTEIPLAVREQFTVDEQRLWQEAATLTDWYTDELFHLPGIAITKTPISRLVLDSERYTDDKREPKAAVGQGVIYSHDSHGQRIRRALSPRERDWMLDNYYRPWHLHLESSIEQQLQRWGYCLLFDCHSFPNAPLGHEDDGGRPRPDICLGTGNNTPAWLLERCECLFRERGYSVAVDFPYAGCLVPERYAVDTRVPAIMIEVNRRLYLESFDPGQVAPGCRPVRNDSFIRVKSDIGSILLHIASEAHCRIAPATG